MRSSPERPVSYQAVQQFIDMLVQQPDIHAALRVTQDGTVVGRYYEFDLASGFQSIVDVRAGTVVGFDAYARSHARHGDAISPWGLFSKAADDASVVQLDRLCRLVHTVNYFSQAGSDVPLYLRVHGRLLAAITSDHGRAFRRMIDALGVPPERIVLQLPAEATRDVLLVGLIAGNYRNTGFRVGVQAANAQDALSLINLHAPDVVKIDPAALSDPERLVPELLAAADTAGAQLVFKRIDSAGTADTLIRLGARHLQGFHYDLPAPRLDGKRRDGLPLQAGRAATT